MTLRLGIIGFGNMANGHLRNIDGGSVTGLEVTAICDTDESKREAAEKRGATFFTDSKKLIRSGAVDAVLIATPHYGHTTIGIDALQQGLHVLVEKPISVHRADCERLIAAYEATKPKGRSKKKRPIFAAMFNQRTNPGYRKIRELIQSGELGELRRVNWIITDWFRTDTYYRSGGWRATWAGEGGGVLLNQCPHQLDLMWWLFGSPSRIDAKVKIGRWHDIEVEDDVTAVLEYPNGATGVFVTTTGEAPGTNRLEAVGTRGKVVMDGSAGPVQFTRNEVPMDEWCRTTDKGFSKPPVWNIEIPTTGNGGQHAEVMQNFVDACAGTAELIAPAGEGIYSVELANAMLLSGLTKKAVDLPIDGKVFERRLKKLIKESTFEKKVDAKTASSSDFAKSF